MHKKIVGILVCMLLITAVLPVTGFVTDCKISTMKELSDEEIFKEIEETEGKILIVDEVIGNRQVKYWEHAINGIFVKNDSILLHINFYFAPLTKVKNNFLPNGWISNKIIK